MTNDKMHNEAIENAFSYSYKRKQKLIKYLAESYFEEKHLIPAMQAGYRKWLKQQNHQLVIRSLTMAG